ncbi:hypothetical protein LEM8419_00456 [Neolewinella maritima]|uniref:Uncharacterized protein n=1 Tax=Neolewinella maritima TaxID=1383882 RepID=A0ABM9AWQ3_9BACT|nr:hypothetical protein [Neolewinella maritima]CAH0999159.1 hypothetical protein LEM8419_00456 [Neolewinella maritima]
MLLRAGSRRYLLRDVRIDPSSNLDVLDSTLIWTGKILRTYYCRSAHSNKERIFLGMAQLEVLPAVIEQRDTIRADDRPRAVGI